VPALALALVLVAAPDLRITHDHRCVLESRSRAHSVAPVAIRHIRACAVQQRPEAPSCGCRSCVVRLPSLLAVAAVAAESFHVSVSVQLQSFFAVLEAQPTVVQVFCALPWFFLVVLVR